MNKTVFSFYFFFFGILIAISQETVIEGNLPGAEGSAIRLSTISDYVTMEDSLLVKTTVRDNGSFKFQFQSTETILCTIDLDYYYLSLFTEPGGYYVLTCDSVNLEGQFRPFYKKEELGYNLVKETESGLNFNIRDFSRSYNEFVKDEFDEIYKKRNRSAIAAFQTQVDKNYANVQNDFFKVYIEYRIAELELTMSASRKLQVFQKYLKDKPGYYNNPEYMEFCREFFNGYLENNKWISNIDLKTAINYSGNYHAIIDTLGKDTLLVNERIRELALLFNARGFYYDAGYYKDNVIKILQQLKEKSSFDEHKKMAGNLIHNLTRFEPGSKAPGFKLASLDGDSVSLFDLEGKPVYIGFMTTSSIACLAEFRLMDSLNLTYGNKIRFVTVSLDNEQKAIEDLKEAKKYNWKFLYNGLDYKLISDFDIKTFPQFILLDENGAILQYPAYRPSEGIENYFIQLLKNKSREP
ncbi:MAG: TlpA family protein disulfide reductase [Bacteroidales bacterium]|nr:TlpA family protein disulfide reductase [Bacteroidales bacterium]